MSDKKIILLTPDDFQRAKQQSDLLQKWAQEMAMSNSVPLCLIAVDPSGKKQVHMIAGINYQKVGAILIQVGEQIKFIRTDKAN